MKNCIQFAGILCMTILIAVSLQGQRPELVVQTGQFLIRQTAFSPDGRLLATGSLDGTIKLWNVRTKGELRTLNLGDDLVDTLAFSQDSSFLAVLSRTSSKLSLWEVNTGNRIGEFRSEGPFAFHPIRNWIAYVDKSASFQPRVVIRDFLTKTQQQMLVAERPSITRLRFSPDGKLLAGSDESTVIWNLSSGTRVGPIAGAVAAFSPDGKQLLTMSHDEMGVDNHPLLLWELATLKRLNSWPSYTIGLYSISWTKDDQIRMIGCDYDERGKAATKIKSWHSQYGYPASGNVKSANCFHQGSGVDLSPDGAMFTIGEVYIEEVRNAIDGGPLISLTGGSSGITSTLFTPDGTRLVAASFRGEIRSWSLAKRVVSDVRTSGTRVGARFTTLAISPDSKLLAAGDARGDGLDVFDLESGKEFHGILGAPYALWSLAFSPDSRLLAAGTLRPESVSLAHGEELATGTQPVVILLDVATQKEIHRFEGFAMGDFSPDNKTIVLSRTAGPPIFWDLITQKEIKRPRGLFGRTIFSPSGKLLATRGKADAVKIVDSTSGEVRATVAHRTRPLTFVFSPRADDLIVTLAAQPGREDQISLWQTGTEKPLRTFAGHTGSILSFALSPDGKYLISGGLDRVCKLWDISNGKELASLISSSGGDWAVLTPQGRFDEPDQGMKQLVHWVVGAETISLSQIKIKYQAGHLLAKILGLIDDLLDTVEPFQSVQLFPEVEAHWADNQPGKKLEIKVKNQGGGIGPIQVFVNNVESNPDARLSQLDPGAKEANIRVDIEQRLIVEGKRNSVRVVAWNSELSASSQGEILRWEEPKINPDSPPELYAIVAGISKYRSDELKLNFASKDAWAMAKALRISGERLFKCSRVHIWLLTEPAEEIVKWLPEDNCSEVRSSTAGKEDFRRAFEEAGKARPNDVFVVYLSGHGVTMQRGTDTYFYLTEEASAMTEVSGNRSVSSDELAQWMNRVSALKRALILDTCGAGGARDILSKPKSLLGDQIKAWGTFKDNTGFTILMGSAADSRSYEASMFGQGLVTYALLQGMQGPALQEGGFVEVHKLFDAVENKVPTLARNIDRIQKPEVMISGEPFIIGQITAEDSIGIPVGVARPALLHPAFINGKSARDDLQLSLLLAESLRKADEVEAGNIIYLAEGDFSGAIQASAVYSVAGEKITVHLTLSLNGNTLQERYIEGSKYNMAKLIQQLTATVIQDCIALRLPGKSLN